MPGLPTHLVQELSVGTVHHIVNHDLVLELDLHMYTQDIRQVFLSCKQDRNRDSLVQSLSISSYVGYLVFAISLLDNLVSFFANRWLMFYNFGNSHLNVSHTAPCLSK